MKNPLKTPAAASLGLLLARLPLGIFMFMAGFNKFRGGVGAFVQGSIASVPSYLPESVGRAYLYALPATELFMGMLIILGWFSRTAGAITSLILISILMAVGPFWNDKVPSLTTILLCLSLLLTLNGPGAIAMDSIRFRSGGGATKPKRAE